MIWPFKHDCAIHGHRFQGRYDYGEIEVRNYRGSAAKFREAVEALRPRTYVHDICVRWRLEIPTDGNDPAGLEDKRAIL